MLQLITDFDDVDAEFGLLRDAAAASGRPLSFTLLQSDFFPGRWRDLLRRVEKARGEGLDIKAQVACRPVGILLGLQCSMNPFMDRPAYKEIASLPREARVARMRDPAIRARILADRAPVQTPRLQLITTGYHKQFPLRDKPDYEPGPEQSVAAIAARTGRDPQEVAYDLLLEDDGMRVLYMPLYNYTDGNFDALSEMIQHPHTLQGLSDAGAHCGYICDASFPTYLITHWARDRSRGIRIPLEDLVRLQANENARAMGLFDRGVIAPGMRADLNLIDFDELGVSAPRMIYDLPAGGRRFVQDASGYVATLVAGEVIRERGESTGAMPGRLVRGAQAA